MLAGILAFYIFEMMLSLLKKKLVRHQIVYTIAMYIAVCNISYCHIPLHNYIHMAMYLYTYI